ncbi:MAG: hypothetical protein JWR85_3578 [Marmoricola sp.]|nr:hypothetical protein [Marmoricola sp.]
MTGVSNGLKLAAFVAASIAGVGGAYLIIASPDAPRWLLVFSGIIGIAGLFATVVVLAFLYVIITQDIRPGIVARQPNNPLALTTELGAMVGTRRFNQHPVRYWVGLTLNHRFFIGAMVFAKPQEVVFDTGKNITTALGDRA